MAHLSPAFHVPEARTSMAASRLSLLGADPGIRALVERLLHLAQHGLPRMFRPDIAQFAFTCRRNGDGRVEAEGRSVRYGAITVLGARALDRSLQRPIFGGETAREYCGRMIAQIDRISNLGDVALLVWAAAELQHPDLEAAIERLMVLNQLHSVCETVPAAWVISALVAARHQVDVELPLRSAHQRLLDAFGEAAGLFPHSTARDAAPTGRSHITCFADQVYPIQALARYHAAFDHKPSLAIAERCAQRICALQGPGGQWWWHYDARNGSVVEGYPVYSVHQHAMGPMALFDLAQAGGTCHTRAIVTGLLWLTGTPELGRRDELIDDDHLVVWRKVGRTDPRKLVRTVRAATSGVRAGLRVSMLDSLFRPKRIDFECRPYELGWLLYAWLHNLKM